MNFRIVKIKDLVELVNGYPFSPEDWGTDGKPIIRIQNLNNANARYNFTTKKISAKYTIKKGDIIIAWAGSLGVYEWEKDMDALLNQHLYKVEFKNQEISKDYFRYVLQQALLELSNKLRGVGLKHLKKGTIENYEFNLPDVEIQKIAVKKLGKVQTLIRKRESAINQLEEYSESLFNSLFGRSNAVKNGWPTDNLGNLTVLISDGTHKTPNYVDEGIPFLSAKNINYKKIDWQNTKYVSKEEYTSLLTRGKPEIGDLLLTKSGTLGRSALVDKQIDFSFYESVALIRTNRTVLNPYFLLELMHSSSLQFLFNGRKKGAAIKHLHLNTLKNINIVVPPIELQNKFENLSSDITSLMIKMNNSLALLNELFQSFIYETFKRSANTTDEIDSFMEDEIQLNLFLNTITTSSHDNEEQYDIDIKRLYSIVERTEKRNKEDPKYLKGIIQRLEDDKIIIETNKEYKYRLSDEASKD